jgi:hypothetical protein
MKTKLAALLLIVSLVLTVSVSTSASADGTDYVIKPFTHGVGN